MLYRDPCVFVVGHEYQICFNVMEHGVAWVEIGDRKFCDSEGGLMRSETLIHKVNVPMEVLDNAKEYTVCFRALPERRPYFPELGELQQAHYTFRPIDWSDGLQAYMLADTHSQVEGPTKAAQYFGDKLDLLLLNGDIPAESKKYEDIRAIYEITSNVTGGHIPVVFSRGNHDYRGKLATDLPQYIGTRNHNTYFTFRIGSLWGIALDCGEDKRDTNIEYGGLVDCYTMRRQETEYLKSVLANAENEFDAPGVTTRIVLTHVPFCTTLMGGNDPEQFDIEPELYQEWVGLLNQMKIDVMLCGHTHKLSVTQPEDPQARGENFPIVVAAQPYPVDKEHPDVPRRYAGGTFEIVNGSIEIKATDNFGWEKTLLKIEK